MGQERTRRRADPRADEPAAAAGTPGKRTRAEAIAPRPTDAASPAAAPAEAPAGVGTPAGDPLWTLGGVDPFGLHLLDAAPAAGDDPWSHLDGSRPDAPGLDRGDLPGIAFANPFTLRRDVARVAYGPLFDRLRSPDLIRRFTGLDHPGLDVLTDFITDPAFATAFMGGAAEGALGAISDTVMGFVDAAKLAGELARSLATHQHVELLRRAARAIDEIIDRAPALLGKAAALWTADDPLVRGHFQGEVTGYVVTQVVILIAGTLAGGEAALTGPYAGLVRALAWLDNPLDGLVAAGSRLSATTRRSLRAGLRATDDATDLSRVVDEINAIRIAHAPKGSAPGIDRDTLYLSRADGSRLRVLLHRLDPDIDLRPYEDGLLVRRGTDEWWMQYDDAVTTSAPARGALGLPAPNVATVELVGYRGVRTIHGRPEADWTPDERALVDAYSADDPLLRAGHVGVTFDGGRTYYGLTPATADMPLDDVIAKLKAREVFPGKVDDDTRHFALAEAMAREGWNTAPVRAVVMFDRTEQPELFQEVMAAKAAADRGEYDLGYAWPFRKPKDGQSYPGGTAPNGQRFDATCVHNCATYPGTIGIPIPERSGRMEDYMTELEVWSKASAPIDGHRPPTEASP